MSRKVDPYLIDQNDKSIPVEVRDWAANKVESANYSQALREERELMNGEKE